MVWFLMFLATSRRLSNSGSASRALVRLATHDSFMVRAHAVGAVHRLAGAEATALLAAARAVETDPAVLAEYAAG